MNASPSSDRRPGELDVAEVAHRLRLATARLARLMRQQVGTVLSPSQYSVLVSIEHNGSLTLGELAAIEQVAPPTITKVVSKLEDDGLVTRAVDARDRRVARVSITEAGHRRLDHSRSRREAWLAQRLDELGADDVRRVADALDVLEALAGNPIGAAPAGPPAVAAPPAAPSSVTAPAAETRPGGGGDDGRPARP